MTRTACGCVYNGAAKLEGCRVHPMKCQECGCPTSQHTHGKVGDLPGSHVVCVGCGVIGCKVAAASATPQLGQQFQPNMPAEQANGIRFSDLPVVPAPAPMQGNRHVQEFGCGCTQERIGSRWERTKACAKHMPGGKP